MWGEAVLLATIWLKVNIVLMNYSLPRWEMAQDVNHAVFPIYPHPGTNDTWNKFKNNFIGSNHLEQTLELGRQN